MHGNEIVNRKSFNQQLAFCDRLAGLFAGAGRGHSRLRLIAQTFLERLDALANPLAQFTPEA